MASSGFNRFPTDWDCTLCQNVNYGKRDFCNRCNAPRPTAGGEQQQQSFGAPQGTSTFNRLPTDWDCPQCQNLNYGKRTACNRCGTPRVIDGSSVTYDQQQQQDVSVVGYESGGVVGSNGGYAAVVSFSPEPGDWYCSKVQCAQLNRAHWSDCCKCSTPRHGGAFSQDGKSDLSQHRYSPYPSSNSKKGGEWTCSSCSNVNYAWREACNRCNNVRSSADVEGGTIPSSSHVFMPASSGAVRKLEQWVCQTPSCGNTNFGWRAACNRCQGPRPSQLQVQHSSNHHQHQQSSSSNYGYGAKAAAPFSTTEWSCVCGNLNFAWRVECYRCHTPRPNFAPVSNGFSNSSFRPPMPGSNPLDWVCPNSNCSNVNFARRTECNRCQTPKGDNAVMTGLAHGGQQPNPDDWKCLLCDNVNFAKRVFCNRCKAAKPDNGNAPQQQQQFFQTDATTADIIASSFNFDGSYMTFMI